MSVRVKICGVTRVEDALVAVEAGADLIGLNFHAPSPRSVGIERAREIARAVRGWAQVVGVFVGATRETVREVTSLVTLDFIQLYSEEEERAIAELGVALIRAIRLKPGTTRGGLSELQRRSQARYILLDSFDPALYGGTGKALGVEELSRFDLSRVFVAGGLRPENVGAVAALGPYGVDVASGVEAAPGIKDHQKLRSFISNAKSSR